MTTILICSVHELFNVLDTNKVDIIVSIRDSPASCLFLSIRLEKYGHVHSFIFKDYRKQRPLEGSDLPTILDVQRMVDLVPDFIDKTVLFHCNAGISRSTSFAYILLRELGMSVDEAHKEIRSIRSIARPNPRIVYLYENQIMNKCVD